jgi:hypothetical protein
MGRMVYLDTGFQAVSAAQDLVEIKMGTGQSGLIHSIVLAQSSEEDTTAEALTVTVKRASGAFTSGSGGGSLTVVKGQLGDATHGLATVERNNTTQAAAGSGALEEFAVHSGTFSVLSGEWERTPTPELRIPLGPSEALVISVPAPDDATTIRCGVALEILVG